MKKLMRVLLLTVVAGCLGFASVMTVAAASDDNGYYYVQVSNESTVQGKGGVLKFTTKTNGNVTVETSSTSKNTATGNWSDYKVAKTVPLEDLVVTAIPDAGYKVTEVLINRDKVALNADNIYTLPASLIDKNEFGFVPGTSDPLKGDFHAVICVKFGPIGDNPDTGDAILILPLALLAIASVGAVVYVSKKKVEA